MKNNYKTISWWRKSLENLLITVVVPVYNVEPYLNRCLDSILSQTYKNIEVILIDDGSNDGSEDICDEYETKFSVIRVFHKANGGLSDARNRGIKEARGAYITFVDSDDFITCDYVEYLHSLIISYNADISICNYIVTYNNEIVLNKKNNIVYYEDSLHALSGMLYQKTFSPSAYGKLFKVILFNEVYFPLGKLYEDIGTIFEIICKANKIVYGKSAKYGYFYRQTGIVRSQFSIKKMDYVYNMNEIVCQTVENYPQLYNAALSRYLWGCVHILVQFSCKEIKENNKEYIFLKSELKKYCNIVFKDKEVRLKNKLVLFFALQNDRKLCNLYNFLKNVKINKLSI